MDMITVDIGNSTFSLAAFKDADISQQVSVALHEADKLPAILKQLRQTCGPQPFDARTVPIVVSSVNKKALDVFEQCVSDTFDQAIKLIGRDLNVPIKIALLEPEKIGTDRLLTAAAAYDMIEDAVVVADFGSAITVDCVNHQGIFIGGVIFPGPKLAARALHDYTDALPLIEPAVPQGALGIDTQSAIEHGIYYSAIGALQCFVERYATDLGRWPYLILTGGYAKMFAEHCSFADSILPHLCHTGIYLTYIKFTVAEERMENPEEEEETQVQDLIEEMEEEESHDDCGCGEHHHHHRKDDLT
jgi:type III pantothenate kinase